MLPVIPRLRSASSPYDPSDGELDTTIIASPRVPIEIIDHILKLVLLSSPPSSTTQFFSVASVTLASKTFRQIALRHYFGNITPETRSHWARLSRMLSAQDEREVERGGKGAFFWVRSLCASSKILSYKPRILVSLTHLQSLSIDLVQEGLSTQHPRLKLLLGYFGSSALTLTSLTLSSLPRIDVLLLRLIAETFPRLTDLYLSCTERLEFSCCWCCFEDSLGCTIHSPIPIDYIDVSELADDFASALKSLAHLTHLHLGIFLSDDQLLYSHSAHPLGDAENGGMFGWCSTCFESAVNAARMREVAASVAIARQLKSIRSVGWSSFFAGLPKNETQSDEPEHDDQGKPNNTNDEEAAEDLTNEITLDMKTTIWV